MKKYCLKLKSVKSPDSDPVYLYFTAMSYFDWKLYNHTTSRYDPATIRYLFDTYLKEMTVGSEPRDIREFLEYPVAHQKLLIDEMFEKSLFSSPEKFRELVDRSSSESLTLAGCYDYFLYIHLPLETYIMLLDYNAEARAHIIALLEQQKAVNVMSRFETAVKNKIPVNLTLSDENYKKVLQKYRKTGVFNPNIQQGDPAFDEKLPPNVKTMVNESRAALSEQLGMRPATGTKRPFNWQADEFNISRNVDME